MRTANYPAKIFFFLVHKTKTSTICYTYELMGFETPSLHAADTLTETYALILFKKHSNLYAARF